MNILIIGDAMLDEYITGSVTRVSHAYSRRVNQYNFHFDILSL